MEGGEYIGTRFTNFLVCNGISQSLLSSHRTTKNGLGQHEHIIETGLALVDNSHIPRRFTDAFLVNRMPTCSF